MSNKRNQYDNRGSFEMGNSAESLFSKTIKKYGFTCDKTVDSDDIHNHIDYFISKNNRVFGVDVKAMKRISFDDKEVQDEYHWLELHGVNEGNDGWIFDGKSDFIVFEMKDSFLLVPRFKLVNYLTDEVIGKYQKVFNPRHCIDEGIYQRSGRLDKLTLISSEKLKKMCSTVLPK